MTAWQRTNILEREEKGLGPVSFKRLLLAGGAGLLVSMIAGRIVGFGMGCLGGAVIIAGVILLTHPKDGFPLYTFLIRMVRGLATIAAIQETAGPMTLVGQAMQVNPEEGILHAVQVFNAQVRRDEALLPDSEWAFLGTFADADDEGLAAVEHPFAVRS